MTQASPPAVVEAVDLHVSFPSRRGTVEALRGVDLAVPRGSLYILLGPNGAGKTTLMRSIASLLRPGRGTLRVFGEEGAGDGEEGRAARLRRVGVLIENPGTYGRLDAREYLSFFGSFYGVADLGARIDELCAGFGLALDRKPVAKLSQGNRQKLQLVRSLLHSPELLLWDEPTDHLDPEAQARVLAYLQGYLEKGGGTALVATHRLEQMEGAATHFGFLRRGRLALAGTREAVLDGDGRRARIAFARAVAAEEIEGPARDLGLLAEAEAGSAALFSGPALQDRLPGLVKALALRDLPILAVTPVRPTLAEVYGKVMAA
jgi:ABC-2 type transport system ATP-binding protein